MTSGFSGRLSAALTSALTDVGVNLGVNTGAVCQRLEAVVAAEVAAIVTNPSETTKAEKDAKAFSDAVAAAQKSAADAAAAKAAQDSQAAKLVQAQKALQDALAALGAVKTS